MRLPDSGEVFESRYEILTVLGEGAFGRVYRARDLSMQRTVALKVLSPKGEEYSTLTAARFVREAKLLAALQDPHTLTLFDFGEASDGLLYMATEFVEGNELKQLLAREQRLSEDVTIHILRQLLSSLREAHSLGLLHRDIKPANIIVYPYEGDRYRVKLLDFGLAKSVEVDATQLTGAGRIAGTPRYMSPEQVLGVKLTPASDLYSLGLVVYEMLTGTPAIDGSTMKELLQAQVKGPPTEVPASFGSPRLRQIVARMTERNLLERAQDAQSLIIQLDTLRRSSFPVRAPSGPHPQPTGTEPPGQPRQPAQQTGPGRTSVVIGVAAMLFVAAIVVAALWPTPQPQSLTRRPVLEPAVERTASSAVPDEPKQRASPDMSAIDTAPSKPQDGCGLPLAQADSKKRIGEIFFGDREMAIVVPSTYDPETRYPLVVLLHDALATAVSVTKDSRVALAAEKHGFIVIAPRDRTSTWREPSAIDEVHGATDYIRAHACIDPDRIYLWGNGFGSAMAQIVVCERDDIAAFASTYYRTDGLPSCLKRAIPHISIIGREDGYAPLEGGKQCIGRDVMSHSEQNELWVDHNRCRDSTQQGYCETWSCDAPYRSCIIPGGRRFKDQEPRTADFFGCDGPATTVEVSELVWSFFAEQSPSER